jgi:PIN domain nuclease of toxin-antitoxin system
MRLLLDTHVFLAALEKQFRQFNQLFDEAMRSGENSVSVSVASLWEIAIKVTSGKLGLERPLAELPDMCRKLGLRVHDIEARDVLTPLETAPETRDPFDRLLLAQCQTRGLRLVTADRALTGHPLAWR